MIQINTKHILHGIFISSSLTILKYTSHKKNTCTSLVIRSIPTLCDVITDVITVDTDAVVTRKLTSTTGCYKVNIKLVN